jgi:hypothetical protein
MLGHGIRAQTGRAYYLSTCSVYLGNPIAAPGMRLGPVTSHASRLRSARGGDAPDSAFSACESSLDVANIIFPSYLPLRLHTAPHNTKPLAPPAVSSPRIPSLPQTCD